MSYRKPSVGELTLGVPVVRRERTQAPKGAVPLAPSLADVSTESAPEGAFGESYRRIPVVSCLRRGFTGESLWMPPRERDSPVHSNARAPPPDRAANSRGSGGALAPPIEASSLHP
jgi:hypothetical protein